jgi:hypothetical protein
MWQKSLELEKEAKELKQKVSGGVKKKQFSLDTFTVFC